jgi:hypothetical protein
MKSHLVSLLLLMLSLVCIGQDLENSLDNLSNPELLNENQTTFLTQLAENPIDINNATFEELQGTTLLSDAQINNLLVYRQNTGSIVSIYELQSIPGFDVSTIQYIAPFFSFQLLERSPYQSKTEQRILVNVETIQEKIRGIEDGSYAGDPYRINARYRLNYPGKLSMGLQADKDAGEKFSFQPKQKQYGFDFYSFHLALYKVGRVRNLILGDYSLQFGQGLTLGSGFSLGKGPEVIAGIKKSHLGNRPYTSISEYGYFRGISGILPINSMTKLTLFGSFKQLDGTINDSSTISTIITTGYHRSEQEIKKKYTINNMDLGLNLRTTPKPGKLSFGFSGIFTRFNKAVSPSNKLYNQYAFSGSNNIVASIDAEWNYKNMLAFGETGMSLSGGKAILLGTIWSLSDKIDFAIHYRNYQRNFHSLYSNSLAENTNIGNERGLYEGIKIRPTRNVTISAFMDLFRFPWLKYQVSAPSTGQEYLARIEHRTNKYSYWYIQYRNILKKSNNTTYTIPKIEETISQQVSLGITSASKKIIFTSKVVYQIKNGNNMYSKGIGLINDITLSGKLSSWSFRMAIFETDDYDTRIYSYERDLLYNFSIPAYYGEGIRVGINAKIKLLPKLDLRIKIARFQYLDRESISTGDQEILSSRKTDLKFQLGLRI